MNRRTMIAASTASLIAAPGAWAEEKPFRVSLVGGGFDGERWLGGIRIDLDSGWKTYWRVPGDAGIPPQFDWTLPPPVAAVDVLYPVPRRLHDLAGETIGYERRVVFPVVVRPAGAAAPGTLRLSLFLGVCKEVCIPVKAEAELHLSPKRDAGREQQLLSEWIRRVPVGGATVTSAAAASDSGRSILALELDRPADDVFVEADGPAYFGAPEFSPDRRAARIPVSGIADATALRGKALKLTIAIGESGIEQLFTVD
jgi:DsbC/DsbD-like thiol-disulfide interchange protein